MDRNTLEFCLSAMWIGLLSAALSDHERELANDTLFRCAELSCAPAYAPEILRGIASHAVNQQAIFDPPEPAPTRPRFRVIGGSAA
jgi:hypothetical protein